MDMSLVGIIVALIVLIIICYRKFNPVAGTLICVIILALFSGISVLDTITDTYFTGFSEFLKNNFLLFATGIFSSILCVVYLEYEFRKAKRNNDGFVVTQDIAEKMKAFEEMEIVKPWRSIIPMVVLFVLLNVFNLNVNVAIILASFCCVALYWDTTPKKLNLIDDGVKRASMVIMNTAAVVGFGYVVKSTVGFQNLIDMLANLGGNPLISFSAATTLIAGATGSGSGGIGIAMEVFAQKYMDLGVNPEVLHRIAAIACNGLDTLPHNSMVITCLMACGMTHKESYKPIFITSVCITLIGLAFAVFLGIVFY